MNKTLLGAILIAAFMLFAYQASTWADGTSANMHPGSDVTHLPDRDSPYVRYYQCRLDSGYAKTEATEGWNGSAADDSAQLIGEWNTFWTRLPVDALGFVYMVRLTAVDTTHGIDDNDSIWISVETSTNLASWYPDLHTIHEFDPVNDTATLFKVFQPDSNLVQPQFGWVRTEIVYHCWQDSAQGFFDILSHTPMYLEETIIPIK